MEFKQFTVDGVVYNFENLNANRLDSKVKEFFKFTSLCHKMVVEHENQVP